jgi:hypothetical protein
MDTPPLYSTKPASTLDLSKAFYERYRSERYRALDPSIARALIHVQARCVAYHDVAATLAMLDPTRAEARATSRADSQIGA